MRHSKYVEWLRAKNFGHIRDFILEYLKSPVKTIKDVPTWGWHASIITSGMFGAVAGVLNGIVARQIGSVFLGLIFSPVGFIATTFIISGFFYYTFYFFFQKQVSLERLYNICFLTALPILASNILTPILPPFILLGVAANALLLIVAFTENFQLPRKPISKIISVLFIVYVIVWAFLLIDFTKKQEQFNKTATPESLDILERELKSK